MGKITVFRNCRLLRKHTLVYDDLWVEDGVIVNPEPLFFDRRKSFDEEIDCQGAIIAPGLIDLQINGGFGVDFTFNITDEKTAAECLQKVGKGLLSHGVTSYCPTFVTSTKDTYAKVLPWLNPRPGGPDGAEILGAHCEGPFISKAKKGAHNPDFIRELTNGYETLEDMYGKENMKNIRIITLAPELDENGWVVRECVRKGITVSLGHSLATLSQAELAVRNGARMITHLFNAMAAFHHRDPGLVGLLTSRMLQGHPLYYGIITDGIHTHPAALRIAYRTHFKGLCIVTDAISALGFTDGIYQLGDMEIEVKGERAVIAGTETLCGAIASQFKAVQKLIKGARCSMVEAFEAASLHPAKVLGIERKKGTLNFGADADFIMFDNLRMELLSTWIAGQCVYKKP